MFGGWDGGCRSSVNEKTTLLYLEAEGIGYIFRNSPFRFTTLLPLPTTNNVEQSPTNSFESDRDPIRIRTTEYGKQVTNTESK
jgi:hypothetical protein